MNAQLPKKLQVLFKPARYKVLKGGRGGAKSWGIAAALLGLGFSRPLRIACAREFQKSIADSVYALLVDTIGRMGLGWFYTVTKTEITGLNGTRFLFLGLKHNPASIKSLEGCDICWVEEAQVVSKTSWDILIPTIRKKGSEIWISFNPDLEADNTYQRFVINPPPGAVVVDINWRDNPWFPEELKAEKDHLKATNPSEYEHIWEGQCVNVLEGAIYANELRLADQQERIRLVPYDRARPVDCYWDLGYGDQCAIWFVQAFPFEFRLIDYLENHQQDITWYLAEMGKRGYVYGKDYLPWDIGMHAKLLGKGKSVEGIMRDMGRKVMISQKVPKADQINAARAVFPMCYFDRGRCADGLHALRHYRYGEIEKASSTKIDGSKAPAFTREPLHDWTSHAADAFAYFGLNARPLAPPKKPVVLQQPRLSERSWMA